MRRQKPCAHTTQRGGALWYNCARAVLGVLFLMCAGTLAVRAWSDRHITDNFARLQELVTPVPQSDAAGDTAQSRFDGLLAQNADVVGWVSIPDAAFSFPVMQTKSTPDFYLRHGFDKQYSIYGVPYLDAQCTLNAAQQSDNLVVYGHNMKTGTVFGCLTGYEQAGFYAQHPAIVLDTPRGSAVYEVYAAFAVDVVRDTQFRYNTYIDLDRDDFDFFVGEAKRRSSVDSGITPVYGDSLLTLSTCEYSSPNGRYVVCARRRAG